MPIRPVKGDNHQHEKEHLWHWRDATVQLSNVITMKPRSMPTWHAFNQEGRTPIHGRWGMTPSNKQSGTPRRIRSRIAYKTKRKDFHVSNKGMGGSPSYENTRTPTISKRGYPNWAKTNTDKAAKPNWLRRKSWGGELNREILSSRTVRACGGKPPSVWEEIMVPIFMTILFLAQMNLNENLPFFQQHFYQL